MDRYFLHLHECGTVTTDDVGTVYPSLNHAKLAAQRSAREIMASDILAGALCLGCHVEIVSEDGAATTVRFSDVVKVSGRA